MDYKNIQPQKNDYMFLDPPYINTKGMYYGVINFKEYWNWLKNLKCKYAFTFDGKRNEVDNTYNVPNNIYTNHICLNGQISGFKKIHKKKAYVYESLYIKNN